MKIIAIFFSLIFLLSLNASAQNSKSTFDFWVGEWNAYWNDSLKGVNKITKILDERIVQENFSTDDKTFTGSSWTAYDSASNIWKQTWVDNSGAYMTFTGGQEGGDVALYSGEKKGKNGKSYYMRMIFQNIESESFDWNWQRSHDQISWNTVWAIKYKRKH